MPVTSSPPPTILSLGISVSTLEDHPRPQWRVDQVGVALGGADLGLLEEAANHFHRGAAGEQQGGKGMAKAVDVDVRHLGHVVDSRLEVLRKYRNLGLTIVAFRKSRTGIKPYSEYPTMPLKTNKKTPNTKHQTAQSSGQENIGPER